MESRLEDSSGNRIGSEKRLARESDGRYEDPNQLQYSETYGTTLSSAQEAKYDEFNSKFNAEVTKANENLTTQRAKADELYNQDKTALDAALVEIPLDINSWKEANGNLTDSAYNTYLSSTSQYKDWSSKWKDENTTTLYFYTTLPRGHYGEKETRLRNTVRLPISAIETFKKNIMDAGVGASFTTDEKGNVVLNSGSNSTWPYIKQALDDAEPALNQELLSAYSNAIFESRANLITQKTTLESDYSTAIGNLSLEQQKVQSLVNENTQYFTDLRAKYATKLANIKEAIGGMTLNG